jgi:anti-anti-sigma regulatory factor
VNERGSVNKKKPPRAAKATRSKHSAPVELDARMTIVQAADLHRRLLACVAHGEAIVVDGTRVEEIDTAVLQLLASLWRTCLARGIACTWRGASDALRQTAALVGVAEMMHFPLVESARDRAHAAA